MVNYELYMKIAVDFIALIAFLWTITQEWRLRKKANWDEVLTNDELDTINELLTNFQADIKRLKAENTGLKVDVWDYVDQVLRPLNQRLATRATRMKEKELVEDNKKGGIIPYPRKADGTN
jgi:hypothetical protein